MATLCMPVFGCAGVCSVGFGGETIFSHSCEVKERFRPNSALRENRVKIKKKTCLVLVSLMSPFFSLTFFKNATPHGFLYEER